MASDFPYSFGWLPDLPDARDYMKDHPKVASLLSRLPKPSKTPSSADLRPFCPPVFDQGNMGSCTANAAAGLLEYWKIRQNALQNAPPAPKGYSSSLSRLFIYKATRDLMQAKGDTGAYIRTTMGSLALFGAPPERYWGYAEGLDQSPPAFCYSFASNYQALSYFRADSKTSASNTSTNTPNKNKIPETKDILTAPNSARTSVSVSGIPAPTAQVAALTTIKETIAGGLPFMFGFTAYDSIRGTVDGKIPFPSAGESILGGHAVLAVGYDDSLVIGECKGAFLIRNSWGESWGDKGYGWLPYEYLLSGIAQDWWCLVKAEWIDVIEFGL